MKESIPPDRNGQAAEKLQELLKEFSSSLPTQFTLGTIGGGPIRHRRYPDLLFKADEKVLGLYYADLDPATLSTNGNGHVNGIEFNESEPDKKKE